MGKLLLICRLAGRDLRRRPAQAVLLLLAITAATATLTLGLALNGVTSHPYQQTRAATNGPDVVAQFAGFPANQGPLISLTAARLQAEVRSVLATPGIAGHTGPYPVASALLRAGGLTIGVEAEGRSQRPAAIDQPKLTAGHWVSNGGVVLERTFATALGVGVGEHVTLNGRRFLVTGIAVTAAATPYPNYNETTGVSTTMITSSSMHLASLNVGLAWVTQAAARALAAPRAPLTYLLNLRLANPATAQAFVSGYYSRHTMALNLIPWQQLSTAAGQLVADEQSVLEPGALIAALLAVASVAVLAAGRMAERIRRVGLLKAVGGTPGLVAAVLVAENLVLALLAAAAGLVIGGLTAPLITSPGAGLIGTPGAPSLTPATVGLAVAVAVAVALASTLWPAIRAARTSTVSALADSSRPPRRRALLIAISARLPVPLLFAVRIIARRLRRAVLGAASIAITSAGIVAVLSFRATVDTRQRGVSTSRLGDPVVSRDTQMVLVITIVVLTLAVLNALFTAWATVLDSRHAAAVARALGASPQQVTSGVAWAQVLPAVPGALLGIPLGIGLFDVANHGGVLTVPPAWWLAVAVVAVLAGVAALASIPARVGARHPAAEVLQAETA
jgi:ABC-type antimicrobial peptide transport system permease subunit